jgi:lauroyl/myristoyl acyltransferase
VTRLIRAAERCFALAMKIVPRHYRFQTALLLARVTVPLLVRTAAYREQSIKNFHRPDEIVLFLLLNALTKNGTRFDVEIVAEGYQHFERAYAKGRGVLMTGHHAALTLLMVRFLHDKNLNPIVVTPDGSLRVPGTSVRAATIPKSHMFLVHMRTKLRAGKVICAMPDRAEHHGRRTIEFETAASPVIIAPAIIEVAARCGAAVLFTEVRVEGGRLVSIITEPAPSSAGDAAAITTDFISFVKERTAAAATLPPSSGANTTPSRSLLAWRR